MDDQGDMVDVTLDRSIFSSPSFSVEAFVDRIANTMLYMPLARLRAQASGKQRPKAPDAVEEDPLDFRGIAGSLVTELEKYEKSLAALLIEEHQAFALAESYCRSIEHREKAVLTKVRFGLDQTSARLRDFEDKIANAIASTVGIEQHLVQSNTRVQRGKSVALLLRHFESFTKVSPSELQILLKGLTKGRAEQRARKIQDWMDNGVSHIHPNYFGSAAGGGAEDEGADDDDDDDSTEDDDDAENGDEENGGGSKKKPTHRAEAAAIAQGFDKIFALRSSTPVAASWILKLSSLSHELAQVVGTASNVDTYLNWLQRELLEDLTFLVGEFRKFFDDSPKTALTSAFGKALLKSLEHVTKLSASLSHSGTDALSRVFFADCGRRTSDDLRSRCSTKPLPPAVMVPLTEVTTLSAMSHFLNTNKRLIEAAVPFLIERVDREVILVETIFASGSTARQQLWSNLMEKVINPYVLDSLRESKDFESKMTEEEARLSPRSKWRCADRVGDAIAYNLSLTTELYRFCTKVVDLLAEQHGRVEVDFLYSSITSVFDFREHYTKHHTEIELLKKLFRHLRDKYTRAFAAPLEGPYLLRDEHAIRAAEVFQHLESAVDRIMTFSLPQETPAYVIHAISTTIEELQQFLEQELSKTLVSVQTGMAQAFRPCAMLGEYLKPKFPEAHMCAFQLLQFCQSQLLQLSAVCEKVCISLVPVAPSIFKDLEAVKIKCFQKIDEDAETIVFLSCQSIVVRALTILSNVQEKGDYCPALQKGKKQQQPQAAAADAAAAAGSLSKGSSTACALFCTYIERAFENALPFIKSSCGEIIQSSADATTIVAMSAVGQRAAAIATGVAAQSPGAAKVKTLSLRQLMFGDGSASVVRLLGVSLYRGIIAHLRHFTVNDEGALSYKQDVSSYHAVMHPLFATDGFDSLVVERLFLLMKETSNLYFMPLENLRAVKENGLLTLMSRDELNTFVQMRFDVKEARKLGVW